MRSELLALGAVLVFLGFGLHHLGQFLTVDEERWLFKRVPKLYEALLSLDWAGTRVNDKPGHLPALLAGIVTLFWDVKAFDEYNIETYLFYWRLPILLCNAVFLHVSHRLTTRIAGHRTALLCTVLIATSPVLIGMSQIVNPDALLWSTTYVSTLAFLLFLKGGAWRDAVVSACFLSLALTCKVTAAFFYLAFFGLVYLGYLADLFPIRSFGQRCAGWLLVVALSAVGFFAIFPACWADPRIAWAGTMGSGIARMTLVPFAVVLTVVCAEIVLLGGRFSSRIKRTSFPLVATSSIAGIFILISLTYVLFLSVICDKYWDLLFWRGSTEKHVLRAMAKAVYVNAVTSNPGSLAGRLAFCAFALAGLFGFRRFRDRLRDDALLLVSAALIPVYIASASLAGFNLFSRYQITLYPLYCAMAASSLRLFPGRHAWVTGVMVAWCAIDLVRSAPFFYCYTNFANFRNAPITDPWGFGGYELAQATNARKDAEWLRIWADREGFEIFSVSKTYSWPKLPWRIKDLTHVVLSQRGERMALGARQNIAVRRPEYGRLLELYGKHGDLETQVGVSQNEILKLVPYRNPPRTNRSLPCLDPGETPVGTVDLSQPFYASFWIFTFHETPGPPFTVSMDPSNDIRIESRPDTARGGFRVRYGSGDKAASASTGRINTGRWCNVIWFHRGGAKRNLFGVYVNGRPRGIAEIRRVENGIAALRLCGRFQGVVDGFVVRAGKLSKAKLHTLYKEERPWRVRFFRRAF